MKTETQKLNKESAPKVLPLETQVEPIAGESYKNAQSTDGLNQAGGKNQLTGLSEPASSTVNHSKESQS